MALGLSPTHQPVCPAVLGSSFRLLQWQGLSRLLPSHCVSQARLIAGLHLGHPQGSSVGVSSLDTSVDTRPVSSKLLDPPYLHQCPPMPIPFLTHISNHATHSCPLLQSCPWDLPSLASGLPDSRGQLPAAHLRPATHPKARPPLNLRICHACNSWGSEPGASVWNVVVQGPRL